MNYTIEHAHRCNLPVKHCSEQLTLQCTKISMILLSEEDYTRYDNELIIAWKAKEEEFIELSLQYQYFRNLVVDTEEIITRVILGAPIFVNNQITIGTGSNKVLTS